MFDYSLVDSTGFPAEKVTYNYGGSIGDVVIPCDLASNVAELHAFLYDDENYTPSEKVQENSSWIVTNTGYKKGDGY
jgi:hypothetical protein